MFLKLFKIIILEISVLLHPSYAFYLLNLLSHELQLFMLFINYNFLAEYHTHTISEVLCTLEKKYGILFLYKLSFLQLIGRGFVVLSSMMNQFLNHCVLHNGSTAVLFLGKHERPSMGKSPTTAHRAYMQIQHLSFRSHFSAPLVFFLNFWHLPTSISGVSKDIFNIILKLCVFYGKFGITLNSHNSPVVQIFENIFYHLFDSIPGDFSNYAHAIQIM